MAIKKSITELVGNTPLLELTHIEAEEKIEATLLAKLESFNPAGSVKDRVAKAIIEDAEKTGRLKEGSVIIEPTSGNTGIGLASVATAKGYRTIIVMPETMSNERKMLIKAYGAELVLTESNSSSHCGRAQSHASLFRRHPGHHRPGTRFHAGGYRGCQMELSAWCNAPPSCAHRCCQWY